MVVNNVRASCLLEQVALHSRRDPDALGPEATVDMQIEPGANIVARLQHVKLDRRAQVRQRSAERWYRIGRPLCLVTDTRDDMYGFQGSAL
jgi:hypothetical protein